ncbi:CMP-N-acetylneuraminate-poly-alpha-2,8-sialyltransferase-like [Branchiostoma floridae x Branchiostoma japonicum]
MYQQQRAVRHQAQSLFRPRVCGARSLAALKTTVTRAESTRAEESGVYDTAARPFGEIPGPKGLPFIGTGWDYSPFDVLDKHRVTSYGTDMGKSRLVAAAVLLVSVLCSTCFLFIRTGGRKNAWALNPVSDLRAHLREAFNFSLEISLTKKTCKVGQIFTYKEEENTQTAMTKTLYDLLPSAAAPFRPSGYKSCSVVGNGGILLKSGCGKDIDAADFVFRSNLPPLATFEKDVGLKSNFTTMNPSVISTHYNEFKTAEDSERFARRIEELGNSFLLVPPFITKTSKGNVERLIKILTEHRSKLRVQPLFVPTGVFDKIERFWREQSGYELQETRLSTGLYIVTFALSLCEHVNIYGFYPSHMSPWMSYLRYHYFSPYSFLGPSQVGPWAIHDMAEEFAMLENLHKRNIVRLRLRCDD